MKIIKITVTTEDGKDNSATDVVVEMDRGAGNIRIDGKTIVTNMDKDVEFRLRHGESLTLTAYQPEAVAFDKTQGMAFAPSAQAHTEGKLDAPKTAEEQAKTDNERAAARKAADVNSSEEERKRLEKKIADDKKAAEEKANAAKAAATKNVAANAGASVAAKPIDVAGRK